MNKLQALFVNDDPSALRSWVQFAKMDLHGVDILQTTKALEAMALIKESPALAGLVVDFHLDGGRTGVELIDLCRNEVKKNVEGLLTFIGLVTSTSCAGDYIAIEKAAIQVGADAVMSTKAPGNWVQAYEDKVLQPLQKRAEEILKHLNPV